MSYLNGNYPLLAAGVAPGTVEWPGGAGFFVAYGTFGGTTIKLRWSPDSGTTWFDVASNSFTADGYGTFSLPPGRIDANVSAGTPAVTAYAASNPSR